MMWQWRGNSHQKLEHGNSSLRWCGDLLSSFMRHTTSDRAGIVDKGLIWLAAIHGMFYQVVVPPFCFSYAINLCSPGFSWAQQGCKGGGRRSGDGSLAIYWTFGPWRSECLGLCECPWGGDFLTGLGSITQAPKLKSQSRILKHLAVPCPKKESATSNSGGGGGGAGGGGACTHRGHTASQFQPPGYHPRQHHAWIWETLASR